MIITIDGFAASGKSTAGELLAKTLGYLYFDTGVMYRAVAWAVLDRQLDPANRDEVSELSENIVIEITSDGPNDGRQYTGLVDGWDVTWDIRKPEVEAHVSLTASYPRVRQSLTEQQRRIAGTDSIVMVGRDIGTVVLPEADLKIFMQASAEERARRRYEEAVARNESINYTKILEAIIERDKLDRTNPVSPTVPAKDAVIVDTDGLTIDEVVTHLEGLVTDFNNGRH